MTTKEPLIKISKKFVIDKKKNLLITALSIISSLVLSLVLASVLINKSIVEIFEYLIVGGLNLPWTDGFEDICNLLFNAAMIMIFAIAIVPAFRMKFFNMGANGQSLMGCLTAIVIMFYGDKWARESDINSTLLIVFMIAGSVIASIIWAVIPALFKAFFNTNETLFTLMMNYIASMFVAYVNYKLAKGAKESPGVINSISHSGWVEPILNKYLLPIIIVIAIVVIVTIYMNKTKHGYEAIVLGDSINTAKYVGMNTKWIIIRTSILSGIICGIIGFLYASIINHSVNPDTCNLGFTGVLVAWLSNFNPIVMSITSLFLAFLTSGTAKITSAFNLGANYLSNVIIGIIFFSILIAQFFTRYNVKFRRKEKNVTEEVK